MQLAADSLLHQQVDINYYLDTESPRHSYTYLEPSNPTSYLECLQQARDAMCPIEQEHGTSRQTAYEYETRRQTGQARGTSRQTEQERGTSGQTEQERGTSRKSEQAREISGQIEQEREISGQTKQERDFSGQTEHERGTNEKAEHEYRTSRLTEKETVLHMIGKPTELSSDEESDQHYAIPLLLTKGEQ